MMTIWLEGTDITKVFFAGIIIGLITGQFITLMLQELIKKIRRKRKE